MTDPRTPLAPQQVEHVKPDHVAEHKDCVVAHWFCGYALVYTADTKHRKRGESYWHAYANCGTDPTSLRDHINTQASMIEWQLGTLDTLQREDRERTPARQEDAKEQDARGD